MKINSVLLVTKEYKCSLTPKVGGTGVFYQNLAKKLSEQGLDVRVFLVSKKEFTLKEEGVEIYSIKDIFKGNPLLELLRSFTGKIGFLEDYHFNIYLLEKKLISNKIKNWITKNNLSFDVAETHDFDGMALCIPSDIPKAIRCHGSWTILEKYFGYKKVHKGRVFCEKLAFKNSKNNIAISRYNKKINKETFDIKEMKLIYNGVDTSFYSASNEAEIIPKSIFYLGNASFEKGADTIINSFLKIKAQYKEATLHFVGNSNHYPQLIKEMELDPEITESINFHGLKNAKDVVKLINKAEVVCFPSKGENFSLSLLEVMAMGKPVICSDIDSFKEIIDDSENGLIARGDNFQEKIKLIFDNNDLKNKVSNNARILIETQFGIDKMITETINYYNEIS